MLVKESKRYSKLKAKLHKDISLNDKIDATVKLFKENENDSKLHFKSIACKKDKNRYSIRVVGSDYRILMTLFNEYAEFFCVCNHDKYNRYNKAC